MSKKKDKEPPKPNPEGRPSKYKDEFCQQLIEHMGAGYSFESFSAVIDISLDRLYAWSSKENDYFIPEFSEAKRIAFAKNLHFWEKKGIDGLEDQIEFDERGRKTYQKSLNSTVWIFNMKNRHRWKDRQEIEMEANITTNPLKEEMKKKSVKELIEIRKQAKGEK